MTFEEATDAWELFNIAPELTCQCDEELNVICQQCKEEDKANSFCTNHLGEQL